jgi:redox-sensitive bicupin YhaK (pirin superfamily)
MFQGEGYHKDSEGNSGVLRAGEVQWMFAGRGLLHSEGPTKQLLESGGSYEFVQVWVNVPGKHKMDEPFYVQATKDKMPMLFNEGGIDLRLASGQYKDLTGPIQSFTPVVAVFGSVKANKYFQLKADEGYWTLLYVLDGSILVDNTEITGPQLVVFDPNGTEIDITSTSLAQLLYLSAAPIDEPVAARGNFVMNTAEELTRAEEEYAAGKFGAIDY